MFLRSQLAAAVSVLALVLLAAQVHEQLSTVPNADRRPTRPLCLRLTYADSAIRRPQTMLLDTLIRFTDGNRRWYDAGPLGQPPSYGQSGAWRPTADDSLELTLHGGWQIVLPRGAGRMPGRMRLTGPQPLITAFIARDIPVTADEVECSGRLAN